MVLGAGWGFLAMALKLEHFTSDWIKPFGTLFLNLLKLIAVPLVFVSLIKGISQLKSISSLSRLGLKTLVIYVCTTILAISIGIGATYLIKPGASFPAEKRTEFMLKYQSKLADKTTESVKNEHKSPMQYIVDIVPDNIINAASDNTQMLKVIFFAILFAVAMLLVPHSKTKPVLDFFDGLNEIILKIIDIIMMFAPYGVFALLAALIVEFSGDAGVFSSLGLYAVTVLAGLFTMIFIAYPLLLKIFTKQTIPDYFKAILPAQLVAFTTSSSAATLPVTLEQAKNELKIKEEVADFVLPVGVTINMDGTSCYQAVVAIFIAQVMGLDLSFGQLIVLLLTALLSSIGTPGVPSGSIIMMIMVLSSIGLPAEGLALILGIDRPLDMFRTVVNVTGDTTVASIVANSDK